MCACVFFILVHFIDGHERESTHPSKNHQSTFTAITADTRTWTIKICADIMTNTANDESHRLSLFKLHIHSICLFCRFTVGRGKYCIIFAITVENVNETKRNERLCVGPNKMAHRRIKGFSRNHSRKLFAALLRFIFIFFFSFSNNRTFGYDAHISKCEFCAVSIQNYSRFLFFLNHFEGNNEK